MDEKDLQTIKEMIENHAKKIMAEEGLCIDVHREEYKKNCTISCEALLDDLDSMKEEGDWN